MADFDYATFLDKFDRFIDELLPGDDDRLVTVDDIATALRQVGQYLADEQVPLDVQAALADAVILPWLSSIGLVETARSSRPQSGGVSDCSIN